MTVVLVVEAIVIAVLALLVVGLLRSHAEILKRLHDLGAGLDAAAPEPQRSSAGGGTVERRDFQVMPQVPSPPERDEFGGAADISGLAADGQGALSVRITGVEHDTVVAFLSSGCLTCQKFWDAFKKPRKLGLPAGTRLVVVTKGPDEESLSAVGRLAPAGLPVVMSSEAFAAYDVPGSPYFVQVHGPSGKVRGEGTGPDWEQVQSLLAQANGDAELGSSLSGRTVPKPDADAEREARIDRELWAAGIEPGHPSLVSPPPPASDAHDHSHSHDHDHDH